MPSENCETKIRNSYAYRDCFYSDFSTYSVNLLVSETFIPYTCFTIYSYFMPFEVTGNDWLRL